MERSHAQPPSIYELRRYLMKPGRRDELIALFDEEFIESQEACGMVPIGHFRDLDDDNLFVWFRGFPSMQARRAALQAFYVDSPAWKRHRGAANATMIDSGNVLLLRPATPDSGFDLRGLVRPQIGPQPSGQAVALNILMLRAPASVAFIEAFEKQALPQLRSIARRITYLKSCLEPNDFPQLPVREDEFAFVVTGICETSRWFEFFSERDLPSGMRAQVIGTENLRLSPAKRSLYGSPLPVEG